MDSFLLYISYSYISDQQTHFSIRKKDNLNTYKIQFLSFKFLFITNQET